MPAASTATAPGHRPLPRLFLLRLLIFSVLPTFRLQSAFSLSCMAGYDQKSIPGRLRRWDFHLQACALLRSAQQVRRPAEQLSLLFFSLLTFPCRWLRSQELVEIRLHHTIIDLPVLIRLASEIALGIFIRRDDIS